MTHLTLTKQASILLGARPEGLSENLLFELLDFETVQDARRPTNPSRRVGRSRREKMQHALESLRRRKVAESPEPGRWRLR